MKEQITGVDIAGVDIAGVENTGVDNDGVLFCDLPTRTMYRTECNNYFI